MDSKECQKSIGLLTDSGAYVLPGGMKRAVFYQTKGKFTDLSMVHENPDRVGCRAVNCLIN